MITRVLPAAAAAVLVLGLATGCGGDEGSDGGDSRPSVDEISQGIQDSLGDDVEALTPDVADCVAEAFHDSDLSDEALQAVVDGDEDYDPSAKDEKALLSLTSESMSSCMADTSSEE